MDKYTFIGLFNNKAVFFNPLKNKVAIVKHHLCLVKTTKEEDKEIRRRFSNIPPLTEMQRHGVGTDREILNREALIETIGEPHTPCEWVEDSEGNYDTACGQCYTTNDGTPEENEMKFCCYCGGKLTTLFYEEED